MLTPLMAGGPIYSARDRMDNLLRLIFRSSVVELRASEFLELGFQLFVAHLERIFFGLVLAGLSQLALVVGIVGLQLAGFVSEEYLVARAEPATLLESVMT